MQRELPPLWPWPPDDPRRFKRVLTSRDFPAPKGLCCWCHRPVTGRRLRYCGPDCEREVYYRIQPSRCHIPVLRRDGCRCALCGLLVSAAAVEFIRERLEEMAEERRGWAPLLLALHRGLLQQIRDWSGRFEDAHPSLSPHRYELDHVTPVVEGGGGCGPEGYRILCRNCHPVETGKLRRRLNAARRPQRVLPLGDGATA